MRKIENNRSLKVLSAALLGVAALGAPAVAETVTVNPDMDGTELSNLNQLQTDEVRNFNFNSSDETYTVTKNLGTSTAGEININGIIGETAKSIIDLNSNNGFVVDKVTNLTIDGVEITNGFYDNSGAALKVSNADANVVIKNSTISNIHTECALNANVGGAMWASSGTLELSNVVFENNSVTNNKVGNANAIGGALVLYGNESLKVSKITGEFNNNSAISNDNTGNTYGAIGGAIMINIDGTIDEISANFTSNKAINYQQWADGAAIANWDGTINKISGDFVDNRSISYLGRATGAAISNQYGTINNISGNFKNNQVISSSTRSDYIDAAGGAIYNLSNIGDISGYFEGNGATGQDTCAAGGAIYNRGNAKINNITADFVNNYVSGNIAEGAAIINWSDSTIGNIKGNFTGNRAESGTLVIGGTLENDGTIKTITGDFSDNYSSAGTSNYGTTLYNYGTIEKLHSSFINNTGEANTSYACGTLTNVSSGKIGEIVGDFIGNKLSGATFVYSGGIYNDGTIDYVSSNFENNTLTAGTYARGGGLLNGGTIDNIKGDFKNNTLISGTYAQGAGLYNSGTIGDIKGNFTGNRAEAGTSINGGTLLNAGTIKSISGMFSDNYSSAGTYNLGTTLFNPGSVDKINASFINNTGVANTYATGTLRNHSSGKIGEIIGDFIGNKIVAGTYAQGGAIYNQGTIGSISGNFLNNSIKTSSETQLALGGAVFSQNVDLNFTADNHQSIFSGNTTEDYRGKLPNAIFVRTNKINSSTGEETFYNPTITLKATNNSSFIINDTIDGGEISSDWTEIKREHQYNLALTGDKSGKININNNIYNANISNDYVTTNISNPYNLSNNHNSLTVNSGTLNLGSLSTAPVMLESFAIKGGNINIGNVDVDLATKTMGRIIANTYGESSNKGSVNVQSFNLLSDGENLITPVEFADKTFKNTVKSNIKEAYTKLYRYDVSYDTSNKYGENGYFVFQRGGSSGGSDSFNPAVLSTPITAQAGAQASMTETFRYVFEHADAFTQLPSVERLSHINANQYALSTDYNNNLGPIATEFNNKAGWFRPYVTFENMNLKNGPKVDAVTYGSLVGFDSDFQNLGKGWSGLTTGYIGYNGSQLNYKGVDTTMNGGVLGLTQTFYKGNFWSALTLSAGASVGQTSTMYGKEDFTSLLAGVGSKTGYNFEFKQGKFIVQPIMFMSYTFVNTFDYTNAAGVKINSDPMHTIQLNPSVRFIANTKTGWQPYASVGMVWNLLNETNTTANGVKLPEMSMKPYVEYGLGVQKRFKDKYTAFGQAMIRNGGRNGIALTFGFRWALGKDSKPIEKVNNETLKQVQGDKGVNVNTLSLGEGRVRVQSAQPAVSTRTELENRHSELVSESQSIQQTNNTTNLGGKVPAVASRTVLKQLTPTQKTALGAKSQNTTKTTNSAILKHL